MTTRLRENSFQKLLFVLPNIQIVLVIVSPVARTILGMFLCVLIDAFEVRGTAQVHIAGSEIFTQMFLVL